MGTFTCECGFLIPDSTYPNELTGTLCWQDEEEAISRKALEDLRAFLVANAIGRRDAWLASYFGVDHPPFGDDAEVIDEIYYKTAFDKGRSVYRCPECGRLYVQTALFENSWDGYERC